MNPRELLLVGLVVLLVGPVATAQGSKAYAQMGTATFSAFECSSLAAEAGNKKEQKRLFLYGYEKGKQFILAVEAKKVKQSDLNSETPIAVLMLLEGPTPDFMLGRIYASAQDDVLKDVFKTGSHFNSPSEWKTIAANKFRKLNCELIEAGK